MSAFIFTIASVLIVSLVSLAGIILFSIKEDFFKKKLSFLVSFSAGTLFGDAFIHLIPEAFFSGTLATLEVSLSILTGILGFLILEKMLHWHHHHGLEEECKDEHTIGYMNLVGDAIHNFVDGAAIAASFLFSTAAGVATTIAVVFHEIPQEISDYGVLRFVGFSRKKALTLNFFSATAAILGAIVVLFLGNTLSESFHTIIIAITAGAFIYIAGTDLLPAIEKQKNLKITILHSIVFSLGIIAMLLITLVE